MPSRRDGKVIKSISKARSKDPSAIARLGTRDCALGSAPLGELRDSSDLSQRLMDRPCPKAASRLRARLWADGYLFLRGLLSADAVRGAQRSLLSQLQSLGLSDANDGTFNHKARFASSACPALDAPPEVLQLLNHPELFDFLDRLFAVSVQPVFGSANLRAVRPGQSTGFHTDSVYMGKLMDRKLPPVIACWIPVTPIPLRLGGLVLLRGSNSHPGFHRFRQTYGALDLDEGDVGGTGWYCEDPEEVLRFGGRFETAEYVPGDVVLFTMHTVHGSTCNCTERWRLSLDFRLQLGCAAPSVSSNKGRWSQLRHDPVEFPRTMEQAKIAWDLQESGKGQPANQEV